jgi:hypothetical protein
VKESLPPTKSHIGQFYLDYMEGAIDGGVPFLAGRQNKLQRALKGDMSDVKQFDFDVPKALSIIKVFTSHLFDDHDTPTHDEL